MAKRVMTYVLSGKDNVSPVFKKAGSEATRQSGLISGAFTKVAAVMAMVGGIDVFGKMIKSGEESAKITAQTTAVLKSTGGVARVTASQIQTLADSLMKKTAIDDETVRTGENMLLTFTNIRNAVGKNNDIFNQATKVTLDVAAAMNNGNVTQENMRETAIQVGKALADPIKGMTNLRRVGVMLTDQQQAQIKAFMKSGNTLGAQKIVLGELTKEFGGSAAAQATASKKISTALSEVGESVGTALLPFVEKFSDWVIKSGVPALQNFVPKLENFGKTVLPIVSTAFGIASDGISAIVQGFKGLPGPLKIAIPIVFGVAAAFLALKAASPLGWLELAATAVVLAVGTIRHYWGPISDFFKNIWDDVQTWTRIAFNKIELFVLGALKTVIHGLANAFGWIPFGIGNSLRDADKKVGEWIKSTQARINSLEGKTVKVGAWFTVTSGNNAYPVKARATGGPVNGPGTATSDSIPAMLSDGEYVVRASSVSKYGQGFFDAVNAGRYAAGGLAKTGIKFVGASLAGISQALNSGLQVAANTWAKTFGSMMGAGGSGVQRWAGLVLQVLAMLRQSSAWLGTVLRRMNQESGGNPYAINLWDINARNGDPSRGLMQVIGGTFARYRSWALPNDIYNPMANIYAGLNYALNRYGSLAALNRPGGYDVGGVLRPGYTLAYNGTGHNEFVVNPALARGGAVNINLNGTFLASKQEVGRAVSDALAEFQRKGGRVPYVAK